MHVSTYGAFHADGNLFPEPAQSCPAWRYDFRCQAGIAMGGLRRRRKQLPLGRLIKESYQQKENKKEEINEKRFI